MKIGGSSLLRDSRTAGVQGEVNAAALRLEFDPGWDGMVKTLTFWNARGENEVKRVLTADLLEDMAAGGRVYLAPIPGEAMTVAGRCRFAVDGYISGKRQRSAYSELVVKPSGGDASHVTEPTPSQTEQLQTQIDTILEDMQAQAVRAEDAVAAAAGKAEAAAASAESAADSAEQAAEGVRDAENAAAAAAAAQKAAAASQSAAANSAADAKRAADQCAATVTGMASFNGRGGHVMPQTGDYTADMVGAAWQKNLLDNWWFADPVNQRGQTEYTANAYSIDRWYANNCKVTLRNGYLTCTQQQTGFYMIFQQSLENMAAWIGRTLTLSVLYRTASAAAYLKVGSTVSKKLPASAEWALGTVTFTLTATGAAYLAIPSGQSAINSLDVLAMKLELGSVQTLAHRDSTGAWVLNEIPDKQQELAKCQRYQVVYTANASHGATDTFFAPVASIAGGSWVNFLLHPPVPMRAKPAVTYSGLNIKQHGVSGITAIADGRTLNVISGFQNHVAISLNSGLVLDDAKAYEVTLNAGGSIILDANL